MTEALPRRKIVLLPLVMVALAALGAAAGDLIRHELIEPVARAAACTEPAPPWWCPIRTGLRIAAQNHVISGLAIAAAVSALLLPGRRASLALFAAAVLGGMGLYLYSTGGAAVALVIAFIGATRGNR